MIKQYKQREKETADGFLFRGEEGDVWNYASGSDGTTINRKNLTIMDTSRVCKHQGFVHKWLPVCFTLVVEDFGVKYVKKKHLDHLVNALTEHYEIYQYWEDKKYCGLKFEWYHKNIKSHL